MKDVSPSVKHLVGLQYIIFRYFVKPYRWLFAGILLVTLLTSILESLSVAAFFPVFQSLLEREASRKREGILGVITSVAEVFPFRDSIVSASLLLIGITLLKSGGNFFRDSLVAYASGTVQHDVKKRLMEKYSSSPYQFFLDTKQGKLIYDVVIAPVRVGILIQRMPQLVAELFKTVAIGMLLLSTFPVATLTVAIVAAGYNWIIQYLSKKVSYNIGKARAIASMEQTTIANEFFGGIRQIMTFRAHKQWLRRFEQHSWVYRNLYIKDTIWQVGPKGLMELTAIFLILGFIVMSRISDPGVFAGNLPVMGVFVIALVQLVPSLTSFGRVRMDVVGSMADCEFVYYTLTESQLTRRDGSRTFESLREGIVFEGVSFAYRSRHDLLKGLNVTFQRGKVTAIVGSSGVGKTTTINLIIGLFEPTRGRVLIDGIPLQEYRLETWRRRIGFVSQDPFIYHATIAENITFGRNGYSQQSIWRAAEIANVHGFISELPEAYETVVGDRGMKLSGGEQQRIAIARAILSEPEILIFDEATSSLDNVSDRLVQEAIDDISKDRTVIVIAHRLSTIRYADKIVVLDQGGIIEEGNHQELLNARGRYFHLVTSARE